MKKDMFSPVASTRGVFSPFGPFGNGCEFDQAIIQPMEEMQTVTLSSDMDGVWSLTSMGTQVDAVTPLVTVGAMKELILFWTRRLGLCVAMEGMNYSTNSTNRGDGNTDVAN